MVKYMTEVDDAILRVLARQSPMKVSDIRKFLPYRESNVRRHLKILCTNHKIKKVSCKRVDLRYSYYSLVKHAS